MLFFNDSLILMNKQGESDMNKDSVKKLINNAYSADQKMRLSGNWDDQVDIDNTKLLSELFNRLGPINYAIAEKETVMKSLVIVMHADLNIMFQATYVGACKMDASLYPLDKLAYLIDRVKVNFKEEQVYGTQLVLLNGEYVPQPIIDIEKIDQRRKSVNLSPLKQYLIEANKYLPK